jgi:serine/threonine protein kinase
VHQEVEIHKILFHPNIVRFYEAFQHEEYFCLILEHVDG